MNYYLEVLKKYTVFSGRSRRAEYWYFYLFNVIASIILMIISAIIGDKSNIIGIIYGLAVIIPAIAVSIRRLHDVGKSGWMIFINLIPLAGAIWFFILMIRDGNPGDNEYGLNPKMTVPLVGSATPVAPVAPVAPESPVPPVSTQI